MKSQWVISPFWDSVTLLSGAMLCLVMITLEPFHLSTGMLVALVAGQRLMALTHSWSTTYLVTCSKLFRPLRHKRWDLFVGIPASIFLFSLALGILITKTVELTDNGRIHSGSALLYIYIGLFMIGHFWHFGRQDNGVLTLYRQKAKQHRKIDQIVDQRYTEILMYLIQPLIYVTVFTRRPLTNIFETVLNRNSLRILSQIGAGAALVLFLAIFVFELRKSNRSFPKLIYYTVTVFHPLFLYFGDFGLSPYWYLSYLWSHWIVATTLALRVNTRFQVRSGIHVWRAFLNHSVAVLSISILVVILTRSFANYSFFDKDFYEIYETLRTLSAEHYTPVGLIIGFFLGEQLVHYYCDRWLYRFKDPEVRQTVAPYL